MKKLDLSALAAALVLASTAYAGEGNKKPVAPATTPIGTTAPLPAKHGQAVSRVAHATRDGQAVSTMAHSIRDFKRLDIDRDGFVTQADVQTDAALTSQFKNWDDDKDTKLSQAEFDAYIASGVLPDEDDEIDDDE
ncbi:MAG TPA: EF-hand domain-containing protein [Candidatus Saccharimonadia bacterium]|nr:EF-hand domain-containing protein [Candidatus Saccharimonadia bacterium]